MFRAFTEKTIQTSDGRVASTTLQSSTFKVQPKRNYISGILKSISSKYNMRAHAHVHYYYRFHFRLSPSHSIDSGCLRGTATSQNEWNRTKPTFETTATHTHPLTQACIPNFVAFPQWILFSVECYLYHMHTFLLIYFFVAIVATGCYSYVQDYIPHAMPYIRANYA